MNRKRKTTILPRSARLSVRRICATWGILQVKNTTFRLAFFLPFFFVIVNSFFSLFFLNLRLLKAGESNEHFQNYDSFVAITALTVLKICSSLVIFFSWFLLFRTCKQRLLNVFSRPSLPCLEEQWLAQARNARPLRCDLKSCFGFFSFCVALSSLKYRLNGAPMERGEARRWPQILQPNVYCCELLTSNKDLQLFYLCQTNFSSQTF